MEETNLKKDYTDANIEAKHFIEKCDVLEKQIEQLNKTIDILRNYENLRTELYSKDEQNKIINNLRDENLKLNAKIKRIKELK